MIADAAASSLLGPRCELLCGPEGPMSIGDAPREYRRPRRGEESTWDHRKGGWVRLVDDGGMR